MMTPGIEPTRMLPARPKSTLPPTMWAMPAAQSRIAAWKTSVPTTLLRGQAVDGDQEDRDHRAGAGRGDPDHEAGGGADHDRGDLVTSLDLEAVALVDQLAQDQRPGEGDDPDHQQGAAEHRVDERVEPVFADVVGEDGDQGDPGDRRGHTAEREPLDQLHVHRLIGSGASRRPSW